MWILFSGHSNTLENLAHRHLSLVFLDSKKIKNKKQFEHDAIIFFNIVFKIQMLMKIVYVTGFLRTRCIPIYADKTFWLRTFNNYS